MAYRKHVVVIALASALVGAMAGIGALQYAQVIVMGGMDPNVAQEVTLRKQTRTCVNPRSIMMNLFSGLSAARPCPVVNTTPAENSLRGAPTVVEPEAGCAETDNARRRAKCNEAMQQGAVEGLLNETVR